MSSGKKQQTKRIPHSPYIPWAQNVSMYSTAFKHLTPYTFSSFERESLSWKKTCYLHAGLNPAMPYRITGKDAVRLFENNCVNTFKKFAVGSTRHAIMCNEYGNVMSDGLLLRTGKDEFITYYLSPYLNYLVDSGKYDVTGEDVTGKEFLFQIGGLKSLDVLEAATGESLRDIAFFKHRPSRIKSDDNGGSGIAVRILRAGVAGTLAYEVHGQASDAERVYKAILAAGEPFGIERLGLQVYGINHTENGFYQSFLHFMPAYKQDQDFMTYLNGRMDGVLSNISGSAGGDVGKRYCNPVEAGWADRIVFDHDFTGREAVEKAVAQPARKLVTLVWNPEDVLDIYASHFRSGEHYNYLDFPANPIWTAQNSAVWSDDVYKNDQLAGISSGRIYSYYYRAMLSLGLINTEQSQIGNEVSIIWGEPGTRQKTIRVKVDRFPFLDLPRNKEIDIDTISLFPIV